MMESCLSHKPGRVGSITAEDLRKDLFVEFSKLSRDSVLLEKEHLQVFLRVRPFTTAERTEGESQECISIEPPDSVILKAPRASLTARHSERFGSQLAQRFQFSQVYGPEATQRDIFDGTTKSLVKDVLDGGNSLIFTYGVTNAGKTFTFFGPDSDGGILPRSLNVIFNSIEGRNYFQNNIKPHRCVDFIRLTKEQQDEEATNKRNLLRRFKDIDPQKTLSSMSSSSCSSFESSTSSDSNGDSVCLDETSYVKFSVWVSFCEIYNENIHDLLDVVPNGSHRRNVLRLAQDVKGNAFVKDLKWVQVNSAEEALKVVKIGRKNQSFSSTKLNNVSSRSHSIFSIRILRIEDVGVPRVQTISELSLCDLAGSERCAKTQNRGERLKEAGNINTSLLTLGKCISALRLNQTQTKFHQHIPFRESKLTHYLQGFFCGRGKACMIININQCASVYDETLNVLKFSAVAQKVVVLNPKPAPSFALKRSARDVSMIINNADKKDWTRRSSLMGWEMSLEDVQEDEDDEEMGEDDDEESDIESMEDNTVLEVTESQELCELQLKIEELQEKLSKEESEKLTMESRIREEVTAEFMELFSNMEKDYNERLQREKEIVEERAERRLEILKNLVNRTVGEIAAVSSDENAAKEAKIELLDSMIEAMRDDLAKIKGDAEAVQNCLTKVPESPRTIIHLRTQLEEMREELFKSQQHLSLKTKEFEAMCVQMQESNDQLHQANRNYENQKLRCQELMSICQEKDDMVSKLQTALDQNVEAATKDRALINNIKEEILHFRNNCKCMLKEDGEPRGEEMTSWESEQLLQKLKMKEEQLNELKLERCSLEKKVCDLSDRLAELTHAHEAIVVMERAEVNKVTNENKTLASELNELQQTVNEMSSKLKTLQTELNTQTKIANELSEELDAAKAESSSQSKTVESLMTEADHLHQEFGACQLSHDKKEAECEKLVELLHEKSRQINDLEQEASQTRANMCQLEELYSQLKYEHDAQAQEHQRLLRHYEAQKFVVAQIKSSSELLEELTALNQQQGRIEEQEQDSRDDCWKTLQEKLIQMLSKLNQHEEVLNIVRTIVENEISKARDEAKRRITAIEEALAHKDAKLETKAQEISKLRELVNDGLNKIKTMSCDLQKVDKERSDVRDQLSEANMQKEQLEKQILILIEEKKMFQQKLCEANEMRDQAGHSLSCTEQNIEPPQTVESNHTTEESTQAFQTTCQDLLAEQKLIEKTCVNLNKDFKQTGKEELLEARPNEIESVTEDHTKLQEMYQKISVGVSDEPQQEERRGCRPAENTKGILKHQLAEKKDTTVNLQRGKDLAASHKSDTQRVGSSKQTSNVKTENKGDPFSPTQEQLAVLNSSILSTKSLQEERFPKPEVEISFTPLKPDRVNVRKPGEEESVTIKLRRTARKRKSPEMKNSVESENRKKLRLKVNNKENIQSLETPTVQGKKRSQLKQKDSPASLKGKKDGALQKIGDFIQSSPTLFGSKAKKIMSMVNVKSPEPLNPSENNKPKKSKRKLFKTQVSSPLDIPSHPVIGGSDDDDVDKESDHLIIKRKLRTRTVQRWSKH
ncbi:kinesin-like protein KIF20B isoform X1 [Carassius auratus]|uniref:Kinesin-like protein KIF20B isoform X1 n=1 Tax=Carassius auratus TaxID=7957 RepID=A0A6P6QGV2_CARAU|nr:kinesin-like protein KIF20B isoform X1 [Carassius auratus]XP_026132497.1 kinesin-like protein KIF20B isoform X1 [Carassius auratus]XP_026132498.1 kinesin-like protein KIF20B isoform X1 [Carassius auratus]